MDKAANQLMLLDLLRHGEPEGGSKYRGNRIDDPLSKKGWQQMRAALPVAIPWQHILTSPLSRCHAFAEEVALENDLTLGVDKRLAEVGFGVWEGKTKSELKAEDPAFFEAFYCDPVNKRPAGAEPLDQLIARVGQALHEHWQTGSSRHSLVVCHAGVIRAAIAWCLKLPEKSLYQVQVDNACYTRLQIDADGKRRLLFHGRKTLL